MEILIKSVVEKRLERLIFIRAELLKPQPSIRGEREQASLSQLSEASVSNQASVNYSTSVSEQGGVRHQPRHRGDHHSQKEVDEQN